MSKQPRTKPRYLHDIKSRSIENGVEIVHEELVVHGDRGLTFKYYHKEGNVIEKVRGKQNDDNTFSVTIQSGDKTEEHTLKKEDLVKMLNKDKHLKYMIDYIKSQKGGVRHGSKRTSSRSSRKSSRQNGSRKSSRNNSSRKSSRNNSSRKSSRKTASKRKSRS